MRMLSVIKACWAPTCISHDCVVRDVSLEDDRGDWPVPIGARQMQIVFDSSKCLDACCCCAPTLACRKVRQTLTPAIPTDLQVQNELVRGLSGPAGCLRLDRRQELPVLALYGLKVNRLPLLHVNNGGGHLCAQVADSEDTCRHPLHGLQALL